MALDFSTPAAIFLFFIAAGLLNIPLAKIKPSWALSSGELKVLYLMMVVACAIPTMGTSAQLLPIITSPYYFALPENNWAELIQPHIKPWLAPQEPLAIKYFYEGLPSWEKGIPWGAWAKPLIIWISFLIVLYFVMICIGVILRRQWMDKERLTYPLAQLPIELSKRDENSALPTFLKNRLMWVGFGIAFLVSSVNGVNHYFPTFPRVELVQYYTIFRQAVSLVFRLSFPMVGFSYLVNLDVAFSLWFFNLLSLAVRGFMKYFNVYVAENLGIYGTGSPIFAHQGMGAMIVLVVYGLWIGKEHLSQVLRKAFTNDAKVEDSDEILPYRIAFWGLVGGLAYMSLWLYLCGMPLIIVPIFLIGAFLLFIGLTRVVAEGGVAEAVASTISSSAVISAFGSNTLGPQGLTSMALTYVWSADIRTFVLASTANGLKVIDDINSKNSRKHLAFWAIMLAATISLLSSIWMLMKLSYSHGGLNGNGWFYGGGAKAPYNYIASKIVDPSEPNLLGWYLTGFGAVGMGILMFLRQRFLWWPFHPIGFTIGAVWIMDQIWFSIFLAWFIKICALRYGGLKVYRSLRPLFLGLILGQFVCNGVWLILDGVTGHKGNLIFWI